MTAVTPIENLSLFDGTDGPRVHRTARMSDCLPAPISEANAVAQWDQWWADIDALTPSERSENSQKTILSLFDESGEWSAPYVWAGYDVVQLDIQNGVDLNDVEVPTALFDAGIDDIYGVLAACPCTHFANSGARWFADKDRTGVTQEGIALVEKTLEIVDFFDPVFWVIENPIGRIQKLCGLPDPRLIFQPHHFGNPYTKKTQLFGEFNANLEALNVHPSQGSLMHQLWGTKPEHKKARSTTPEGFALSFFRANR
jgi:hypothetical protein